MRKASAWDWRAVQLALGEPTSQVASRATFGLGQVAARLRTGEVESARVLLAKLATPEFVDLCESAARTILEAAPPISRAAVAPGRFRFEQQDSQPVASRSVMATGTKAKLHAANATHSRLIEILGIFLSAHGHRVESSQFVDAFARLRSGPAVFEAKSLTDDNELAQIRQGLSQLYEYRYRHGLSDASLWLVLSRSPKESWLIDYLEKDRGIHVLWLQEDELTGPFIEGLLESGSSAMRRGGTIQLSTSEG
jgi:hypothetical protein